MEIEKLAKALKDLLGDVEYAQPHIEPGLIGNRTIRKAQKAIAEYEREVATIILLNSTVKNKTRVIITGNLQQYKDYLRVNDLNEHDLGSPIRFANKREHILGLRNCEVIFVGEFWLNKLLGDPYLEIIKTPLDGE